MFTFFVYCAKILNYKSAVFHKKYFFVEEMKSCMKYFDLKRFLESSPREEGQMGKRISNRRKKRKHYSGLGTFCICGLTALVIIVLYNIAMAKSAIEDQERIVEVGSPPMKVEIYADVFGKRLDVTWMFDEEGEVNYEKVGEYKVICRSKFLKKKEITLTVHVVDTVKPTIMLIGSGERTVTSTDEYVEEGFYAYDIYDGDLTEKVQKTVYKKEPYKYVIQYKVSDNSGNEALAEREITVVSGAIYLTFDDGPSETITPRILDLLSEKGVKATFFVVGFDEEKEKLISRIYDEGNTIGIHGMSHNYSEIYTSIQNLINNFDSLEEQVYNLTGGHSNFIRFPGGSSNTVSKNYCKGIMTEAVQLVTENGYIYFDWNVDSQDAGGANTAEEIYNNVISGIKPGRTNIVLMHDSAGHQATYEALEGIIEYGIENDYVFRPITDKTPQVKHNVAN